MRLLTGIQPTGALHIGNYLGAIKPFLELQSKYECYFIIVDLHALTIPQDPKEFTEKVYDLAATLIACGIDPKHTTLFVQSLVPEHSELTWIFNTITPIGELERMTQYKEKGDKHGQNAGLLTYPVLQAADVLLYNPDIVPVGEDQAQHLELTRIILRKFNNRYGETFKEPKTLITKAARVMALNDPTKKMSKSIPGSAIGLDDSPETIRKAVMSAVTDSSPTGERSAGITNLFTLLELFAPERVAEFEQKFQNRTLQYSALKTALADALIAALEPIQKDKQKIAADRGELYRILRENSKKAHEVANAQLQIVRKTIGLI